MAGEDAEYSEFIRSQPCCYPGCKKGPRSEQHHQSGAGMGLRAHDHCSMPLCQEHHHHGLGQMGKEERRYFETWAIIHHRRKWIESNVELPTALFTREETF
jgi:hypothetical protein